MLTAEDKQWVIDTINLALAKQTEELREFIMEGRRQDRAWAEKLIDQKIEEFAQIVRAGFDEVHARMDTLETALAPRVF